MTSPSVLGDREKQGDPSPKSTPKSDASFEAERIKLSETNLLSRHHIQRLERALDIVPEKALDMVPEKVGVKKTLSESTLRRHSTARQFYTKLHGHCGQVAVAFCIITISITNIAKNHDTILASIVKWWKTLSEQMRANLGSCFQGVWKKYNLARLLLAADETHNGKSKPSSPKRTRSLLESDDEDLTQLDQSGLKRQRHDVGEVGVSLDEAGSMEDRAQVKNTVCHDELGVFLHETGMGKGERSDLFAHPSPIVLSKHQTNPSADPSSTKMTDGATYELSTMQAIHLLSSAQLAGVRIFMSMPVWAKEPEPIVHFGVPHAMAKEVMKRSPQIDS